MIPTHLSEAKEAYLREAMRAYIFINGGSAVALLAFLPAIWDKAPGLKAWILYGLISLVVGVALGTLIYPLRHFNFRHGYNSPKDFPYQLAYYYMPAAVVLTFLCGIGLPILGALRVGAACP